jgi:hypothetical protein
MAIALLPVLAYFALRIRLMPVPDLNDPAMHTTFIVDPRDIFERYTDLFTPTSRLREGARVGLLVPARLSYLMFGSLGGFVVFRYVLALVALGPVYVLMRRLAGVAAGFTAAVLVLTCPVILTAWGTDYPDSASVSYLIGALACLAMPSSHRVRWMAAGAALLTLAAWAFASSVVIGGMFAATYAALRLWRERDHLIRDAVIAGGVFAAGTALLAIGSALLLGQLDFIRPTLRSIRFLATPAQEAMWHSSSWAWAPYDTYLLVLPVIAAAWLAAAPTRLTRLPTPHLMIGGGFCLALLACAILQFFGKVQLLEEHYFSSLSWAGGMLTLALVFSVVGKPLLEHPVWRWTLPAAIVLTALLYELVAPAITSLGGLYWGLGLAGAAVVVAVAAPRLIQARASRPAALGFAVAIDALLLVLTVMPVVPHSDPPGVVFSPPPQYAAALGGGSGDAVDEYQVTTEIPGFAGPAAYPGEVLMMWWPGDEQLLEPIGIFHASFNSIPGPWCSLNGSAAALIEQRHPAQILLMSNHREADFPNCLAALAPYAPQKIRAADLTSGSYTLHVWLIQLNRYFR